MLTFNKIISCLFLSVALVVSASERVQSPDAHWKTIKTPHYRIHYPANPRGEFESFAMEVASKIEGIHAKVIDWVGFETKKTTDVLIQDPMMEANGAAIPLLNRPILLFWKTPPEPDSGIGHYNNWVDLLVTHELVHLHHMMRPQNGRRLTEKLLPISPITLKTPRFIIEGYATMLEGRLTGTGRPHSAYRAAIIRQWALQGKLPDYDAVSGTGGFRGGSMAYLIGSAYLDWLERQNAQEPDVLKKFWKQLTSKKRRPYDDSFKATFGIAPKDSYDRWRAEVTHDAIALEQIAKAKGLIREGELVARFDGEITDMALNRDGTRLMARIITSKKKEIRIWDLTAPPEDDKKKKSKSEKQDKSDPNEVEDRPPEFTEPKKLATIGKRNGILPRRAWWTGNNQVTLEMRMPDGEGILKPSFWVKDLETKKIKPVGAPIIPEDSEFIWKDIGGIWNIARKLPDGQEQQVTSVLSAAWQPAPTPDGKALYYVQLTATGCEIRKLNLEQPALESVPLSVSENMLTQDAVLRPPDGQSLLPPPSDALIQAENYSVWGSHHSGSTGGLSLSPSTNSLQFGWGGSDILNRLNWYAAGAFDGDTGGRSTGPTGPRGGGMGLAYRGWRFAPSLQAFSSLEKPSVQRFEPITGFDRERHGAEFAFTWAHGGMSPYYFRPFVAWESVENTDASIEKANRYIAGASAELDIRRSRGEWGVGINAVFQGAFGSTKFDSETGADDNWKLLRLKAGLRVKTPAGPLLLSVEEGRIHGDYTYLDAFHLGGQNTGLVPGSLNMNRVQQPALPDYQQIGDRMRKLRADYGFIGYLYFEKTAVWRAYEDIINYQRVVGAEIRLQELFVNTPLNLAGVPTISLGIHRPLDGAMKDRTVFTLNFSITL